MAFDWFRRKFSGDSSEPQAQPSETNDLSEQTQDGAVAPEAAAPEAIADAGTDAPEAEAAEEEAATEDGSGEDDESLAWAKAAFENIRRKQAAAAAEAGAEENVASALVEPVAVEPVAIEPVPIESVAVEPAAVEPAAVEPVTSEPAAIEPEQAIAIEPAPLAPEPEPEPELATSDTTSDAATPATPDPETPEIEVSAPATPEPVAAPLGFLARAEAERAERLERLKATAIEEPEPEPEPEAEPELDSGPRIVFDADFLWSAEVLAAQGRRPEEISYEEITWLNQLRQGLSKTRRSLVNQLKAVVGQGPLNDDAVVEIESLLLQADVGVNATDYIIASLQQKLREEALPPAQAIAYLKRIIRELLDSPIKNDDSIVLAPEKGQLNIWLLTGVNGAGKTTTIGKLAHLAQKSDYRCLIAAADTFRAAAVQQVKVWGDRSGIEVISNPGQNTDPAAVVFDAIAAAQARNTELLLVDTAGRLQNKKNLMDELSKVRRIIDKQAPGAKVESLLVLDSTLGQNGLRQAEVFAKAANISGVVLTKLDGTARGGVALAVVRELGLPIRFIGAGEGIGDLRPFSSYEFVEALLSG